MVGGVTIGDKHSIRDWEIYLAAKPEISSPSPKVLYVDIPGADGSLDMTESLTGEVSYYERTIRLEFVAIGHRERWNDLQSEIQDYLQGQNMQLVLDEDRYWYYTGRFKVKTWESHKGYASVTIEGLVNPYKYERTSSLEPWIWDSFDFEHGIIRDYRDLQVDGELTLIIPGRRKKVSPSFTVHSNGNGLDVLYKGVTYHLPDGTSRVVMLNLGTGEHVLKFSGNGTVSIDYRGGRL